ncbi:MAG TPA: two-component regulator propeller domain-containing protein [Blastocatellia bacterium]|nr:two-component regulator propeller domain-containing protein [Blastocatellia bacterium]HMX24442.1 two-component regulator propeller domain-containing protein [Blastocatellia bacterium]HNG32509.1 two-component regulator propeller domain-containing protein [Blastocatellia bacterium]
MSVEGRAEPTNSSPFLVTRWTTENGLPQNSVTSIVQTPDGYLWVGTFGGLARFDGVRFTIFNSGNTPGMVSNRISTLHVGRDGSLWIGAETGEVTVFRNGRFSFFARFSAGGYSNQVIWSIYEDRGGSVWVCTQEQGMTRFVGGDAARAEFYDRQNGLPSSTIKNVLEDRDGNLWICTKYGLALFQPGPAGSLGTFSTQLKTESQLLRASAHPNGGLWVFAETTLHRFHQGRLSSHLSYPAKTVAVVPFSETATGDLLFGYNTARLFQLGQPGRASGAATEYKLTAEDKSGQNKIFSVYSLCTDREGNIWMGTIGSGLWRLSRRRVTMLQPVSWRHDAGGGPVLGDRHGNLWFGTVGGLFRLGAGGFTADFTRDDLRQRGVWRVDAMYEDAAGDVWFGILNGVARYREGRFTEYRLPGIDRIQSIGGDRRGNLWLGTLQGLVRVGDGRVYRQTDGLINDDVRFIFEDRAGALWLGTPQGLSRFQDGRFTNYTTAQGLSNNFVRAVHEEPDGTLWLGTYGGGLNRLRPHKDSRIAHITTKHGLFDDFISRIIVGDDDTFWLLGNRGIFRVSRRALDEVADGQRSSLTCLVYDKADGMDPSEGQGGFQPAGWRARDGKFYFPTIQGVAVVDPGLTNPLPPPVQIERLVLDGVDRDPRRPLEVLPGQGNLEIHYTGLSFAKAEQVRFSYRMSEQEAWQDVGTRRTAYFPQLQPGTYRFSVRAFSPDGVWSEHPASLNIVVKPPFWRTAWFASLVATTLAGLTLLGYRRRVAFYRKRVARQEAFSRELMAAQERERRRIAAELHDGLGQSLVIIQRRGRLCLEDGDDPEAMREQVEEIVEASGQALEEVRDMIFDLRPRQLDELGLTGAVADLLARVVGVNGWQLDKRLDRVDGLLAKESENNLFRIVQESLNNISKHAAATRVSVSLTRGAGGVELTVTDNGRGFAPEASIANTHARHGFGLRGIRERARLLGGQVLIESAPGQGATVRVNVPYDNHANSTHPTQ